ncbi:MAG: DUF669 domain-containing protein [Pseudomonadota bacterium]
MANLNGFDASKVDPSDVLSPVPDGNYPVVITESEFKDTKSGTGQYLQLTLEVIDGPMKGRKIWDRLNLVNQNSTAREIAERQLSQICHATGVLTPQDSVELHGKPLTAKVVLKPADPGYNPSNEVKGYLSLNAANDPAPAAAPEQAQPAPAAATQGAQTSAPPWAGGAQA